MSVNNNEAFSREHAALEPRFLGGAASQSFSFRAGIFPDAQFSSAVITRSFARIHETNCKKQGLLPLTFSNEADYDKVQPTDKVDLIGVKELAEGSKITLRLKHKDGSTEDVELSHSFK